MGERAPGAVPLDPAGERVSFPHTPFLWTVVEAAWVFCRPTWPAASKTNASWPAHQLGRAGEVVYCREEKWKPERLLSAFSQRVPTHVPSPPSRWAGRYGPFNVRAAGQVTSEKYNFPPHNPTREGSPEGRTSSLWGSFPHFFPRNGAPAGQAKVPCRFNGVGETPQRAPPVPTAQGQNTKNQPLPSPGTAGFLCVLASLTPPSSAQTPAGSPWRPSSRRAGSGWLQWPPQ